MALDSSKFVNLASLMNDIPDDAIVCRVVHHDKKVKVILFGFSPGQQLSTPAPAADCAVIFQILSGEGQVTIDEDAIEVGPGSWVYMQPEQGYLLRATSQMRLVATTLKDECS